MKVAVRYYSRSGNIKKIAEAAAKELGVKAETVDQRLTEPADILFVGAAIYAGKIHKSLEEFLTGLTPDQVKKVVVLSSSLSDASTYPMVKAVLDPKGIPVDEKFYHCKGKFLIFNKNRPNDKDMEETASFVKAIVG